MSLRVKKYVQETFEFSYRLGQHRSTAVNHWRHAGIASPQECQSKRLAHDMPVGPEAELLQFALFMILQCARGTLLKQVFVLSPLLGIKWASCQPPAGHHLMTMGSLFNPHAPPRAARTERARPLRWHCGVAPPNPSVPLASSAHLEHRAGAYLTLSRDTPTTWPG